MDVPQNSGLLRHPVRKPALRAAFHARGLRLTRQRLTIYRELEGRCDHPDVERLYQAVKSRLPQISLFTVYRAMNALEGGGLVWRVATWRGHARYDANVEMHAHFLCEACGKIDDLTMKMECRELLAHAAGCVADGKVRRMDVMMVGACEDCLAAQSKPDQA